MLTIVIDMMGADKGVEPLKEGVKNFLNDASFNDAKLVLVGNEKDLEEFKGNQRVELVPSKDILPMEAGALESMRMKTSSMNIAVDCMVQNHYDAVVSAGSTGGFISLATIKMKMIEGIERAALVSPFPTRIGKQVTVLDIGANNENSAYQIFQFAQMGAIYSRLVMGVEHPSIYLLSNGVEEKKGSPEGKEAYQLIKQSGLEGFKGNIEGRDALRGEADVIVTGGYAGNIFLKTSEGMAVIMSELIKEAFYRNLSSKIGYVFARKGFKEMKKKMDYKSFGGAMLLGINGVAVKAHGSSDAYSFYCALKVAYRMSKEKIVEKIKIAVSSMKQGE